MSPDSAPRASKYSAKLLADANTDAGANAGTGLGEVKGVKARAVTATPPNGENVCRHAIST